MLRRRPSCAVQPLAVIALLSVFLLPFEAGAANAGPLLHRLSLSTAGSCKTGGVRSNDALGPEGIAGSIWCRGEQQKWQQRDGAPTVVGSGGTEVQPCSPRGNRGRRGAWGLVTMCRLRGGGTSSSEEEAGEEEEEEDGIFDADEDEGVVDEEDFGEANFIDRMRQDWANTPIITKTFFQISIGLTVIMSVVNRNEWPSILMLEWKPAILKLQLWRLIAPFFFVGPLGLQAALAAHFQWTYMSQLEKLHYREPHTFVMLLAFGMVSLLIQTYFIGDANSTYTLGHSLGSFLVMVWSRKHAGTKVNVLDMFELPTEVLPYFFVLQTYMTEGAVSLVDITGLLIGYSWQMLSLKGLPKAPKPLVNLFRNNAYLKAEYARVGKEYNIDVPFNADDDDEDEDEIDNEEASQDTHSPSDDPDDPAAASETDVGDDDSAVGVMLAADKRAKATALREEGAAAVAKGQQSNTSMNAAAGRERGPGRVGAVRANVRGDEEGATSSEDDEEEDDGDEDRDGGSADSDETDEDNDHGTIEESDYDDYGDDGELGREDVDQETDERGEGETEEEDGDFSFDDDDDGGGVGRGMGGGGGDEGDLEDLEEFDEEVESMLEEFGEELGAPEGGEGFASPSPPLSSSEAGEEEGASDDGEVSDEEEEGSSEEYIE